jgi:hypothetical protein
MCQAGQNPATNFGGVIVHYGCFFRTSCRGVAQALPNHVDGITSERVGRDTAHDVSNIDKYYIASKLAEDQALGDDWKP